MNSAIIVAAGAGSRFGGDFPKQFAEILGRPVLVHTLERFENCALIDEIVLVLPQDNLRSFPETAADFGITKISAAVAGGDTRTESVLNGLSAVRAEKSGIVAIHDGARPAVPDEDIREAIKAAERTGASCLVAGINDTVKMVEVGRIVSTVDRKTLRRALTPQCFKYDVIIDAYERIVSDFEFTDDSGVVEAAGYEVEAVEGSPLNIKITYEEDLAAAESSLHRLFG